MEMITLWLLLIFFTITAELHNPGLFYFLSLSCGAVAALVSCLLMQTVDLQIAWFAAIAALAWVMLKRVAKSKRVAPYHTTNSDALVGKRAQVIEPISYPEKGYVKMGGEIWPAAVFVKRSIEPGSQREADSLLELAASGDLIIEVGEYVEVIAVVGNHLVVKRI